MTIITSVGTAVTVTNVTARDIDIYGDATETSSTSSINGVIEILPADEEIVKSGILNVGDAIGYFDPDDASVLKEGNRINHNSIDYVITAVDTHQIGGNAMHMEVQLKRLAPQ